MINECHIIAKGMEWPHHKKPSSKKTHLTHLLHMLSQGGGFYIAGGVINVTNSVISGNTAVSILNDE